MISKVHAGKLRHLEELAQDVPVEMQVNSVKEARSEPVIRFALSELSKGTTYNTLRKKLGLGLARDDRRWRALREILLELILPETEQEALEADLSMSSFLLKRIETFGKKVADRAVACQGEKNEAEFLKLELESMKVQLEKYNKRTEHYLKMKDIKNKEKRKTGTSIFFINKFNVARPEVPDVPIKDVTSLAIKAAELSRGDDD